jgi:hypothetical protein
MNFGSQRAETTGKGLMGEPQNAFAAYMLHTVSGLCYCENDGVAYFRSPLLEKTDMLRHGFTTRKGGISTGPYAGLNLSVTRQDNMDEVRRNYALAADALGVGRENAVLVNGVHGVHVKRVGKGNRGEGLLKDYAKGEEEFDGMVTNDAGVCLVTIHADCTPLFVLDPVVRAIGLCHAGWRGTVDGMGHSIIESMQREFGSRPEDLLVMMGPHIGACCFEVHADVAQRFAMAFPGFGGIRETGTIGKYYIDLTLAMAYQLYQKGVPPAQVNIARFCTSCNPTLFYSYRRNNVCGAMASFMQLV